MITLVGALIGGLLSWGAWALLRKHMWLPAGEVQRPWWLKAAFVLCLFVAFGIGREHIGPQAVVALADGLNSGGEDMDYEEVLELEPAEYGKVICRNLCDHVLAVFFRFQDQDKDRLFDLVELDYGSSPELRTKVVLVKAARAPAKKGKATPVTSP